MRKSRLLIAYDGTSYSGWQKQAQSPSVQFEVEKALSLVLGNAMQLSGASRTDKGVHAMGQVAHFDHFAPINNFSFLYAVNGILPPSIRVLSRESADPSFHARYDAIGKTYTYDLHTAPYHLPFTSGTRLRINQSVNIEKMSSACRLFVGEHDFFGLQNHHNNSKQNECNNRSTTRIIFDMHMQPIPAGMRISISGNGFLYKMVRNIVGTLLALGKSKIDESTILQIFFEKKRPLNKIITAPALGLCLRSIDYGSNITWPAAKPYDLNAWI